jgi:hypothetical protein
MKCRITITIGLLIIFTQIIYGGDSSKRLIEPYGFFKLDMTYSSALMAGGNFAKWVNPYAEDRTPNTNITVKQSRFGFNLKQNNVTAKLEIDFYGVGSAENKAGPMLRKAYADIALKNFNIRFGQDSDVISPLVPSTHNYSVAWWAGNIGYRRPMLKIYHTKDKLSWTIALARNIGGDVNGDGIDDGTAGILPELQGRLAYKISPQITIGVSSHFGIEDTLGTDGKYETWSGNIDYSLKINKKMSVEGELFTGVNLASKLGSIGNPSTVDGLSTMGGWINMKMKLCKNVSTAIGASLEDPDDKDLMIGYKSKNYMAFGNFYYNLKPGFKSGLEISYWNTEYKTDVDRYTNYDGIRTQIVFLYIF